MSYLNPGLAMPVPAVDGLDAPYWEAARNEKLVVQRCLSCGTYQWGPEWICHACHSDRVEFVEVPPYGIIYSHERVWHPVHPALKDQGPYIVVLVELPGCDGTRMVGNLIGDPHQSLAIGTPVRAVFEHHNDSEPQFTLVQWEVNGPR